MSTVIRERFVVTDKDGDEFAIERRPDTHTDRHALLVSCTDFVWLSKDDARALVAFLQRELGE